MAKCTITIPDNPDEPFRLHSTHHINFDYWLSNHLAPESDRQFVLEKDRLPGEEVGVVWLIKQERLGPILQLAQCDFGNGLTVVDERASKVMGETGEVMANNGSNESASKSKLLDQSNQFNSSDQLSLF